MFLLYSELGMARTSSPQLFYMYVSDIFIKENGWGENFFALIFCMHVNDVDFFIRENWAHPKFLY